MEQRYNLKSNRYFYADTNGDDIICANHLNKYFDLDDKPEEITVILSTKPSKNSYKARFMGDIQLQYRGKYREANTVYTADNLFTSFLKKAKVKSAYVSVEA